MTTPSRTTFVTLVKLEVFRMKTAVIILGLLIISVVHCFDAEKYRKYCGGFTECCHELGIPVSKPNVEAYLCANHKYGSINDNGEFILEASLQKLNDILFDSGKVKDAQAIFKQCYDQGVNSAATYKEQAQIIANCIVTPHPDTLDGCKMHI